MLQGSVGLFLGFQLGVSPSRAVPPWLLQFELQAKMQPSYAAPAGKTAPTRFYLHEFVDPLLGNPQPLVSYDRSIYLGPETFSFHGFGVQRIEKGPFFPVRDGEIVFQLPTIILQGRCKFSGPSFSLIFTSNSIPLISGVLKKHLFC